jgi:hypothetical protein
VVRRGKSPQDSQENVGTIQRKMYYIKESAPMGGWKDSKMEEQTSLMKTTQAIQPLYDLWTMSRVHALVQEKYYCHWYSQ